MEIEIRPFTILIGGNSSGKSSVLQLMAALNQNVRSGQNFPGGYNLNVDLGNFNDVLKKPFKGDDETQLVVGFKTKEYTVKWYIGRNQYSIAKIIKLQFSIKEELDNITVIEFIHTLSNQKYITINEEKIDEDNFDISKANLFDVNINSSVSGFNSYFFNSIIKDISKFLENMIYIPPNRGLTQFGYEILNKMPYTLGSNDLTGFQKNVVNTLGFFQSTDPNKIELLNDALSDLLDITITNAIVEKTIREKGPFGSISVYDQETKVYTDIVNTGFGSNQVIAMGIAMIHNPNNSLILIEEPEIHLHPKLQSKIINFIDKLRGDTPVVISTHSEHFLTSVQRKVRKKEIEKDQVAIYYFQKTNEGAQVEKRDLDDDGRIQGGLPGFFEHSLEQLKDFIDET